MNDKADLVAELTASTYDSVADPRRLDKFFVAWDLYMEQCLADERRDELEQLNDPAIQVHFQRGVELFERIGRESRKFEPQAYVDNLPGPAIIMDERGNVVAQNSGLDSAVPPWRTLLDVPVDAEARSRIRQWIMDDHQMRAPFVFVPCFWDGGETKTCMLSIEIDTAPVADGQSHEVFFMLSSIDLAIDSGVTEAFAAAYDLSQAEAEIAMLLSQGLVPEKIAKIRKVSINTVRSQLRSLLSKTHAWGIQDLVRMSCNFSAHFSQMQKPLLPDASRAPIDPHVRESILTLPDGRKLAYLDMGALDGDAVVMFHSIISGPFLTPLAMQACAQRNIRVIAPSVPGYGKSDPIPNLMDSEFVASVVSDAERILEHLGIETAVVLGHIVGAVCAQRFARDNPDMTKALVMVGYATHFKPSFFNDMKTIQRIVGKTVLSVRKALPFIVRASIGLLDTGDTAKLIRLIHDPNDFDWKDLRRPDILEVVVSGIRHCVEQDPEPFCQYSPISVTDWMHEASEVKAPVTIFLGDQDTMVTPKFIEPYLENKSEAQFIPIKNGGKFLLHTHWDQILDTLQP